MLKIKKKIKSCRQIHYIISNKYRNNLYASIFKISRQKKTYAVTLEEKTPTKYNTTNKKMSYRFKTPEVCVS